MNDPHQEQHSATAGLLVTRLQDGLHEDARVWSAIERLVTRAIYNVKVERWRRTRHTPTQSPGEYVRTSRSMPPRHSNDGPTSPGPRSISSNSFVDGGTYAERAPG
jgi:hypothetical protein